MKVGTGHKLSDRPRVLLLGDEHLFPSAGSGEVCFMVMRIKGGSFQQFQALIDAHRNMTWTLQSNSLVVPCLLTHLFRVGFEVYWKEFTEFQLWIKQNLRLDTALCIPPFPEGYSTLEMTAIRQLYARLQAGHFGDSGKRRDIIYSLWRPLMETGKKMNIMKRYLAAQPIYVHDVSGGVHVPCDGMFLAGFKTLQEWQHGMPPCVERVFINLLSSALEKFQRHDMVLPDESAVESGLDRDPSSSQPHKGRKIFVLGASNMVAVSEILITRAIPMGVTIVPMAKKGDFMTHFLHNTNFQAILSSGKEEDLLFINCLGNELLAKDAFYSDKSGFHHLHPNLLNDQEFVNLAYDFNNILKLINDLFVGRVVVMGPMPRSLEDCCPQPSHWIRDEADREVNMEAYVDVFTEHIFRASRMFEKFSFVGYKTYLGKDFIPAMVTDNVHWSETTRKDITNYMLMFLSSKSTGSPKPAEDIHLEPFSTALKDVKITVIPVKISRESLRQDSSEEEEEEGENGGETADNSGGAGQGQGGSTSSSGSDNVFHPAEDANMDTTGPRTPAVV